MNSTLIVEVDPPHTSKSLHASHGAVKEAPPKYIPPMPEAKLTAA